MTDAVVVAIVVLGSVLVVALLAAAIEHVRPARNWHRWRTEVCWRVRRRSARRFVDAVASGTYDVAEAHARRVLDSPPSNGARTPRQPRSWDERATRIGNWREASAELRRADGLGAWCPSLTYTAVGDRDVVTLGRVRGVQLPVLARTWAGEHHLMVSVQARGGVVRCHVQVRPHACPLGRESVELWVHVEGPPTRRSRRIMRTIKRLTRSALRRWAAHRSPTPHDGGAQEASGDAGGHRSSGP